MFCTKCGSEVADNMKFCTNCGQPVEQKTPAPTPVEESKEEVTQEAQQTTDATAQTSAQETPETEGKTVGAKVDDFVNAGKKTIQNVKESEQLNKATRKVKDVAKNVAENEKVAAATEKVKGKYDTLDDNKKKIVKIGGIVVAVLVVVLLFSLISSCFGGNYKTPLKEANKVINKKQTDVDKIVDTMTPSFVADTYKDLMKVMKKSDMEEDMKDKLDDMEDSLDDMYDALEDEYGKNVKSSYKITDKDKLDKDDLEEIQDAYNDSGDDILDAEDDIEDLLDESELSNSEQKKVKKILMNYGKKLEKAKVKKGYELDVEFKVKGKEDDESGDAKVTVIKVNNEWIIYDIDVDDGDTWVVSNMYSMSNLLTQGIISTFTANYSDLLSDLLG